MKLSLFNITYTEKEYCLVYNTFSSAFVRIPLSCWEEIVQVIHDGKSVPSHLETSVKDLIKSGFIVSDKVDELNKYRYLYYSNMFDNQSIHLFIAPTMKCNFNCYYCFESGNKNHGLMSDDVVNNLVQHLYKNREKEIVIHWFGGEPLLGFRQILHISRLLNEKKVDFISTLITNGSLLTKSNIVFLEELHLQRIQISLDGIAKDHDRRRTFKNGKPSFQLIIANLRNLMQMTDNKVCIQVTVDHDNETAYDDVVTYMNLHFKEYVDSKRILIGRNFVRNRTDFDTSNVCFTVDQQMKLEWENLSKQTREKAMRILPGLYFPCMLRCKNSFAVDSKGDMFLCLEHLGNPRYRVGSFKEGKMNLNKIAEGRFMYMPFEDSACTKCAFLPICGGGCPIDRAKVKQGSLPSCCTIYKDKLVQLLPRLYELKCKQ